MVAQRQAFHVLGQMRFDLAFGLHHKAQADVVAQPARQQPHAKGAGVPQGVQERRPCAQLSEPLTRPGQVVAFLLAGPGKLLAQRRVIGAHGLGRIQRLCADLAHMVDPHQGTGQGLVCSRQLSGLVGYSRAGLAGVGLAKQGAQGDVKAVDEGVHGADWGGGGWGGGEKVLELMAV